MPTNKEWYLKVINKGIFILKKKVEENPGTSSGIFAVDVGPIVAAKACGDDQKIKFKLKDSVEGRMKLVPEFTWEKTPFSKQFKTAQTSHEFMKIWESAVIPNLDKKSGTYSQPPNGSDASPGTRKRDLTVLNPPVVPAKRAKKTKTSSLENDIDQDIEKCYAGCFEISTSCLVEPRTSRRLRLPDRTFIESLKEEMALNPTSLVSPIVGVACLKEGETFDKKHPNSYTYETIGGNNSRVALQELMAEKQSEKMFNSRLVAVYVGLTDDLALRLASKHNRASQFTHQMTTQDKVASCRTRYSAGVKKNEWRKICANLLCQTATRLDDSMIYFLASLPEDEYKCLLEIFDLHEECELKDQKLSRAQRGASKLAKIDCKGVNFRPLRGIECEERMRLLTEVRDLEISFSEMAECCRNIKKLKEVQSNFVSYLDLDSWEEAIQKFPNFTSKQQLQPFFGMAFRRGKLPPSFVSFCQLAKRSTLGPQTATPRQIEDSMMVTVDHNTAVLLPNNVLTVHTNHILDSLGNGQTGIHLTIVDPPEEWSSNEIEVVIRLVKSVNASVGLQTFNIVILAEHTLLPQLKDVKTRVVYYQDLNIVDKESTSELKSSVSTILICHYGDVACFPQKAGFQGNLLTVKHDTTYKEYADRAKPKPKVYKELISLLSMPGQWIFDPICGIGKVAVSSLELKRSVIACESKEDCLGFAFQGCLELKSQVEDTN